MLPPGILYGTFCFSKEAVRVSLIITSALFRLWTTPLLRIWSLYSLLAINHEKHSLKNVFSKLDEKSLIIASALFRLWSSPCASRLDKWVYLDWLTNHHFPRVSGGTDNYLFTFGLGPHFSLLIARKSESGVCSLCDLLRFCQSLIRYHVTRAYSWNM